MGARLFLDKPLIKLATDAKGFPSDPEFMTSLRIQIEQLPSEAKSQYYKLTPGDRDRPNIYNVSRSDFEVLKLFLQNCKKYVLVKDQYYTVLHLNAAVHASRARFVGRARTM